MVSKIVVIVVIVSLVVIIGVVLSYPNLLKLASSDYSFGEELKGFPIEQTSVTFTDWKIIKASEDYSWQALHGNNDLVVVNYTVRNIGDTKLQTIDFQSATAPILKYGNSYYADPVTLLTITGWNFYVTSMWDDTNPKLIYPSSLMPNQEATNGYIQFEVIHGTQPIQLVFHNKNSPSLVVNFE